MVLDNQTVTLIPSHGLLPTKSQTHPTLMTLLDVKNLSVEFRTEDGTVEAVNDVSLSVDEGETLGLVGESGSGKSVTALGITDLVTPPGHITGGEINFRRSNILENDEQRLREIRGNEIGMIFQDPNDSLNPVLPVAEQVAEALRAHNKEDEGIGWLEKNLFGVFIPRRSPRKKYPKSWGRAVELMEETGIPDASERAKEYPHQFSGGMQQRVMIAQAIACEPSLLIADEPTTALDVTIEAQILNLLDELKANTGMGMLFISHDLSVVAEICDRVAVMYAGQIVETGPVEEIFKKPKHPYTRGLIEAMPTFQSEERLHATEGQVPTPINMADECYFAPRCDYAHSDCYESNPRMYSDGDQSVRCVLYDEENTQNTNMAGESHSDDKVTNEGD